MDNKYLEKIAMVYDQKGRFQPFASLRADRAKEINSPPSKGGDSSYSRKKRTYIDGRTGKPFSELESLKLDNLNLYQSIDEMRLNNKGGSSKVGGRYHMGSIAEPPKMLSGPPGSIRNPMSRAAKLGLAGAGILGAGALGYGAYRHFSQEKSAEVIENRYLCKLAEVSKETASTTPKTYQIDKDKLSNSQVAGGVAGSFLGSLVGHIVGGHLDNRFPHYRIGGALAGTMAGGLGGYSLGSR